jgi:hypothetical protein
VPDAGAKRFAFTPHPRIRHPDRKRHIILAMDTIMGMKANPRRARVHN